MGEGTVLVRLGALGDVVLLGSVTAALPGPVTVVTRPRWLEVAARLRGVSRVVPVQDAGHLPGRWIDLQRSPRTLWLAPRARRVRKHSLRRRLARRGWGPPRPTVPELYARACGVTPIPAPWIDGPDRSRDTLALIPGAAWEPKRPSAALLVAAARGWSGPVAVLGGPGEGALVEAVVAGVPGARPLVEEGFAATLDVLTRSRVAVGGDTGLVHLAAACGARVVTVFGPTHPDDGFAVHPGELVQRPRAEVGCRPCALHRVARCRRGDLGCHDLSGAAVQAAVARCAG